MSKKPAIKPAGAEPLTTYAIVDYAGILRGRSIARDVYEKAPGKTLGWVPANMSLTPFDIIADGNPWGSLGDLRLKPDKTARYRLWPQRAPSPLDLVMADITELDGRPWVCCPRSFLKTALADFKVETGAEVLSSFEQEFQVLNTYWAPAPSFAVSALRRADPFGPELMASLKQAGVEPEVLVAEYGQDQFEITLEPAKGVAAADRAAVVREVVREAARLCGWRATFAPKTKVEGVGNGVHLHFSFLKDGKPIAYDVKKPGWLSDFAGSFCAGVLRHLPAIIAFTAPSPISGYRLQPHHWSASYTWMGDKDREASLRICPMDQSQGKDPAKQYNIEFRAADATASPHLVLGLLVRAGLEGVRAKLPAPPLFKGDPEKLSDAERKRLGLKRLPTSIPDALAALKADKVASGWFDPLALETYEGMKQMELKLCGTLEGDALCQRYAEIY